MPSGTASRRRPQRRGLVRGAAANGTALLILDMISCWDFPDGDRLLQQALEVAPVIASLKRRCIAQGVPVIYANDNRGQWRSDFKYVTGRALQSSGDAGRVALALAPGGDDYFVLKPKHSAFFATPLELLLDHLQARRLIVTGTATDQCVASTVADARMRDFEVVVPRDGVATTTRERNERALAQLREALRVTTPSARHVRLQAHRKPEVP